MPRYSFHVVTANERFFDDEARELRDFAAAKLVAIQSLGEILADFPDLSTRIEVIEDESARIVFMLGLSSDEDCGLPLPVREAR